MIDSNHWLVCLDLTKMDAVLIGYTSFLASVSKPETITFMHIVEAGPEILEIIEQFPEINSREEFTGMLRNEINDKIDDYFEAEDVEIRVILKEGKPTTAIIQTVNSIEPDLLLMGKKAGYAGEGVIAKRILKYVATSVLFIPENSRNNLKHILVPVDFSEQSAKALEAANELLGNGAKSVTALHIYEYRAQYFPYLLSEEEKEKADNEVRRKKEDFIKRYDLPDGINFTLTRHNRGKLTDTVYDEVINSHADMIIISSKAKKMPALIRHDFTDKMVNHTFGVPLFVLKNKEKYKQFLISLFKD
jgi:nucleotide-binding universal stress UspA family protein